MEYVHILWFIGLESKAFSVCLGWTMILLSSRLWLFCFAQIFAAMNVAGECIWGGVMGRQAQEFPLTWLPFAGACC